MRNVLQVARREFLETLRTKAFLLSVFVAPLIISAIVFFVARSNVGNAAPQADRHLALCDLTGLLGDELRARFESYNLAHPDQQLLLDQLVSSPTPPDGFAERMKDLVRRNRLYAYIQIDPDALDGQGRARIYLQSVNLSTLDATQALDNLISRAASQVRCLREGIAPEVISRINRRMASEQVTLGDQAGQEATADAGRQISSMLVPFFFMFLMFMGITGMAQFLLSSVLEEKTSRIIEVLLAAMPPLELLAGKIIGMAAVGFTAIAVWGSLAYLAAQRADIDIRVPLTMLPLLLAYYVLGFLLVTSLLAGLGSVCNSHKEAQSMMMPVMFLLTLPMLVWFIVARDPDGTLARILSFIPPLTPTIMTLRLTTSPRLAPWEVVATLALLAASVPLTIWASARIFRTGILMYGKRQSLREIFRWIWQK